MIFLIVDIIEYFSNDFPGFVRCKFTDIYNKTHYFYEKVPIVSSENINEFSIFPRNGYIAGEIINKENDIITFSIMEPYNITSDKNISIFFVKDNKVIEMDLLTD